MWVTVYEIVSEAIGVPLFKLMKRTKQFYSCLEQIQDKPTGTTIFCMICRQPFLFSDSVSSPLLRHHYHTFNDVVATAT